MKIGLRVIKTGLAVTVTTYLCRIFNLEPALFGAISAVVNMQPSIYLTFKTAWNQIYIHILGVLVGMILGYSFGGNPISMGLTAIIIIVLYRKLNLQSGILMGIVTSIFVLSSSQEQFLDHAIIRSSVIFVGLIVAMIVNFTLWPPRHGEKFIQKLKECNEEAVKYFCQAVENFVALENQELHGSNEQREKAIALKEEVRTLVEYIRQEHSPFFNNYLLYEKEEWIKAAEKMMRYNEALIEKGDHIYELVPTRIERRLKSGAPPVSEEFKSILDILKRGTPTIFRVNNKMRDLICDKVEVDKEDIDHLYWDRLTDAVELWQQRLTNKYYLHALIEVAVVANEIRWVAQEGKKIINNFRN